MAIINLIEFAKWHAQRAHVLYVPTRPTCPTCPRAQVYFRDRKIKNGSFVPMSLVLDLNFEIS